MNGNGKEKPNSKKRSRSRVCAVIGCPNGDYQLSLWLEEDCKKHKQKQKDCPCDPPFT